MKAMPEAEYAAYLGAIEAFLSGPRGKALSLENFAERIGGAVCRS